MQNNVLDYLNDIVVTKSEKMAFLNESGGMTFGQVYEQSRGIGTYLYQKGIHGKPIVVFMRKHPKEVTAFFGVIAAGNFYVPIDEEMPAVRIQMILDNVQPPLIICDQETIALTGDFQIKGEIVLYDEISSGMVDDEALQRIHDSAIDTDLIYIVFTSGSTGIPKGVAACHRSVIDYIEQLSETLEFNEDTVFGNQTPLYLDACLKELYPTLKYGATTYFIPKSLFKFPVKLVEFMNDHQINTICWVVSALTMISAFGTFKTIRPEYLHTIAFGSEVFPIKQFHIWKSVLPNAQFINLYGPTEGTGMCCYYKVEREFEADEVIPIGRPFKNTEVILLNDKNERAEKGETGEICIRGTSVTMGYYNDFERTQEVYVQNPLNQAYPEVIYRTGDLGKYNAYGELVFVSRKDHQIKHMGHRIELGEIEAHVNLLEGVKQAGCVYDEKRQKIVLYYVGTITDKDLVIRLKEKLPRYMIPNRIMHLEEMPLMMNGKLDRMTLKNMISDQ